MKRLLSWFVLLLLVTVQLFSVAADNCEGILSKGPDGAEAITAQNVPVSADVNVNGLDAIQIYMNLDEANDIVCTNDKEGTLQIGDIDKCKITYKFDKPGATSPTGSISFMVNGKPATTQPINYDAEAPHQVVMTIQKKGISFRGPMDDTDNLVLGTEACMPIGGTLKLSQFIAPEDSCILQLELKSPLNVVSYMEGGQKCDQPVPFTESPPTDDTSGQTDSGSTTTTSDKVTDPNDPTGTGSTTTTTSKGPGPGPTDTGSTTTISGTGSSDTASTTPSSPDTTTTTEADNLVIIIVSVVVGVIVLLVVIGIVVYCFCFKNKKTEEDAEAGEGEDKDAEAGAETEGTQGSDAKEPEAADGPEAENTQRDSEKKTSDKTQSEGADNTQNE